MKSEVLQFLIQTRADVSGIRQSVGEMERLKTTASGLMANLKMGALGGAGFGLAAGVAGMFSSLVTGISTAVNEGKAFNVEMDNAEKGIAQVLAKFLNLDAVASKREAAKALAQIAELEPKTAGTMSSLTQGFMATVASAQAAGMTVAQNIDLVGQFSNALANANIPAEQLSQELRSIFTGNITPDSALAKVLDITNEDVAGAKAAGNLYDMLTAKIGTLGEAGDSAAVRISSFESAWKKAAAQFSKPIFDAEQERLAKLTETLNDGEVQRAFASWGQAAAEFVRAGTAVTNWAMENATAIRNVAQAAGVLGVAWGALKLGRWVGDLLGFGKAGQQVTQTIAQQTAALVAQDAALAKNAAGWAGRNAAAGTTPRGVTPGGMPTAAGNANSSAPSTGGAYSRDAYRAARAGGRSPADALSAARKAMTEAAKGAESARGAFSRLGGVLLTAGNNLANFIGAVVAPALPAGLALGTANQQAGISPVHMLGGFANENDIEASASLAESDQKILTAFLNRAASVATKEDLDKLMQEVTKFRDTRAADFNGNLPQGEQRVVQGSVNAAQNVMRTLAGLSPAELENRSLNSAIAGSKQRGKADDEARAEARAESKSLAERRKADAESRALEDAADLGNAAPIVDARQKAERSLGSAYTTAEERDKLQEQLTIYDRLVERATEVAAERARNSALLERELEIGRMIEEGRTREAAIARAGLAVEQQYGDALKKKEISQTQYNELKRQAEKEAAIGAASEEAQQEIALLEAQGAKRLADVTTAGRREVDVLRDRLAIEQEIADARYRREMASMTASGASATELQTLRTAYETGTAERSNELAAAEAESKANARMADPRRPKGIHRGMGAGEILRNADGSLADGVTESALGTLQAPSRLPPSIGPQPLRSSPQTTAAKPAAPGAQPAPGGAGEVDAASKAVTGALKEIAGTLKKTEGEATQTAGQVATAAAAIQSAFASIRKELAKMQSQLKNAA